MILPSELYRNKLKNYFINKGKAYVNTRYTLVAETKNATIDFMVIVIVILVPLSGLLL